MLLAPNHTTTTKDGTMTHSTEHWFTFESDARESRKALLLQGASVSRIAYDADRELYVFDEYESRATVTLIA